MFLSYLMLLVALCLSAVAAFYSIVGLAAIFSAAVLPIIIMGTILEVAKLTVTVWLHEYWRQCKWVMKAYLVPAVVVLMIITSMGIFGFLSKAHIDQIIPTGDRTAQIALFDERIANERAVIENSRSLIKQMDDTVNGIIEKGESREIKLRDGRIIVRSPAELALQVRRSQARDRDALTKTIEESQARIVALQEERAPIAKEVRGLEAEVGPIKYVAALIYGDNPDTNLLERAVRWVIIILVAVFDPLAIMMLLAATESLKWHRELRATPLKKETDTDGSDSGKPHTQPPNPEAPDPAGGPDKNDDPNSDQVDAQQPDPGDSVHVRSPGPSSEQSSQDHRPPGVDATKAETVYVNWPVSEPASQSPEPVKPAYLDRGGFGFQNHEPMVAPSQPITDHDIPVLENEETWAQRVIDEHDSEKAAMREWKKAHPESTIKEQRRLVEQGKITQVPWSEPIQADNESRASQVLGFGIEFPRQAVKGDQFLRVDMMPSRLYKYNGNKWIEIEKHLTDQYAYDVAYIDYLISKISSGEYDADLLSEAEQDQIRDRLAQTRPESEQ